MQLVLQLALIRVLEPVLELVLIAKVNAAVFLGVLA